MITGIIIQDTLRQKSNVLRGNINQFHDSSALSFPAPDHHQSLILFEPADTMPVCFKNSISNNLFYDSTGSYSRFDTRELQNFPFVFTEINRKRDADQRAILVSHLKGGDKLPKNLFHNDWILPLLLLTVLFYGIIYSESLKFFKGIIKFVSFGGLNESTPRDMGALFHWQSTLFNLASFINISLFAFLTILWYDFVAGGSERKLYWLAAFGIIVTGITLRHIICLIVGNLSGKREIFREYLIGIYQVYRLAGVFLLVIVTLILYTTIIPLNILFYTGFSAITILYFIRIFRLFLIFLNRHVSIFYLILYLCALEILPVVIIIRFVTGLV